MARNTFRVQTVQELDEFLTKAKAALIQANGEAGY